MNKYASAYLGGESDGKPLFRDESPNEFAWPACAVFAVHFRRESFRHLAEEVVASLPRIEFFGEDGWPIHLPSSRKVELDAVMRAEFQVHPWDWRCWSGRTWEEAVEFSEVFFASRAQSGLVSALLHHTPSDVR
ncbi:MAG: hypothetical protein WA001_06040 [Patescibacteria group bacterium]